MDQRIALTVLCPHCGALEGDECWGPAEHRDRFIDAMTGGGALRDWPEYAPERLEELAAMPYGKYRRTPEWQARRAAIHQRANGRCESCRSTRRLQVHHVTYERRGYEWPSDLRLLCGRCHTACHGDELLQGASMSYGAYVQACINERRRKTIGTADWDYAAVKYANDNFPDYPEPTVTQLLLEMRWPDRPVTVSEVNRELKRRVSPEQKRAWLRSLDEPVEAPA